MPNSAPRLRLRGIHGGQVVRMGNSAGRRAPRALRPVIHCATVMVTAAIAVAVASAVADEGRPSLVVAAVQAQLRFLDTAPAFQSFVERRVRAAMRYKPDLVVFPEDIGLPLISLGDCDILCAQAKTVEEGITKLAVEHLEELAATCMKWQVSPQRALWLMKAAAMRDAYQTAFQTAAQRNHVYIVAGSVPMRFPDARREVYNTCCLFAPDGRMQVVARKVHLIGLEQASGIDLSPASPDTYKVVKLPKATIGCIVCADAWDPAIARRLVDQGAEVLVQVSANPELWNADTVKRWNGGLLTRVQELNVYGVSCMAVGGILNVGFEGLTQFVAPKAWTDDGSGVMAYAASPRSEGLVVQRLDLRRVRH